MMFVRLIFVNTVYHSNLSKSQNDDICLIIFYRKFHALFIRGKLIQLYMILPAASLSLPEVSPQVLKVYCVYATFMKQLAFEH